MSQSLISRRKALTTVSAASLLAVNGAASSSKSDSDIRVVVWDERQGDQKKVYANFIGNHIAGHLGSLPGIQVLKSVGLDDPEHGLGGNIIDNCDVLIGGDTYDRVKSPLRPACRLWTVLRRVSFR
jgi:hypothetical protein